MKHSIGLLVLLAITITSRGDELKDSVNATIAAREAQIKEAQRQNQIWEIQQRQEDLRRRLQTQDQQRAIDDRRDKIAAEAPRQMLVPNESTDERTARHANVRAQIDAQADANFAKVHPYLPASHRPPVPASVYAKAFANSDAQTIQAERDRMQAEIDALKARLDALEAKSSAPKRP